MQGKPTEAALCTKVKEYGELVAEQDVPEIDETEVRNTCF